MDEQSPVPPKSARVLFVDDSTLVRTAAERLLRARGISCEAMCSLGDVFRASAGDLSEFRAALLDIELDDGHGTDAAAYLRHKFPELPIAFLTGGAAAEELARATAFGPIFDKAAVVDAIEWAAAQAVRREPGRRS